LLLREPQATEAFAASYSQFPRPEHPRTIDLSCRDNPKQQKVRKTLTWPRNWANISLL
jgi:hypothetical protein